MAKIKMGSGIFFALHYFPNIELTFIIAEILKIGFARIFLRTNERRIAKLFLVEKPERRKKNGRSTVRWFGKMEENFGLMYLKR